MNYNEKPTNIKLGFDCQTIEIPLEKIIPLKTTTTTVRTSAKFRQIIASIKEIGIIEPPVVALNKELGNYMLLDGHLRIEALRGLGKESVVCLISTDDEAFTYNKHINRLSIIQEHKMIVEAVKRGVPEEKIAQALNLNVKRITRKRHLVDGICPEAVDLLKDKIVPENAFLLIKKLKATRQIEIATLMNDAGTYSMSYVRALFAATPQDQLLHPAKPKKVPGFSEDQMSRMETEMKSLQREYRLIEDNYGTDVLNLTLAKGYLGTLIANSRVRRFLQSSHPEILSQFEKIADMTNLAGTEVSS